MEDFRNLFEQIIRKSSLMYGMDFQDPNYRISLRTLIYGGIVYGYSFVSIYTCFVTDYIGALKAIATLPPWLMVSLMQKR